MPRCAVVAIVSLAFISPLRAQPEPARPVGTLFGEEKRAIDELAAAERLAAEKKWPDAVRRFQQILSESGDLLVPVGEGRSLPARWVVHQKLAAMAPAGRKFFRDQVADSSRKLLEQGTAARSPALLERLVADAFCSKAAEQALHLLGDLALERGEFESAERWWCMLARPASKDEPNAGGEKPTFDLVYPEPSDGGALARAKQILAMLFMGTKEQAKEELKAFRKKHAAAEGALAGIKGKYCEILQKLIDAHAQLGLAPGVVGPAPWPTFSGNPSRNSSLAEEATPYWPDTPNWRVTLPGDPTGKVHRDSDPPLGTGSASRSLAFHPVIAAGYVLVADAARVLAYQQTTGKLVSEYSYGKENKIPETVDLRVPSRTDARYTLTVDGNRVYARVGAQAMKAAEANKPHEMDSAIVCLGLNRDRNNELELKFRWQIRARMLDTETPAMFEGAPIVANGRMFVAKTRFDGRQSIAAVECYDADAPNGRNESPPLRWKQDLWSVEMGGPNEPTRHRHDLLTLAGPFVVYCTHSGAIVALDAATGKRAWAVRYPSVAAKPLDGTLPRDLCPCIFAQGRVFAAPADADRIFCFDALTGEKIWESSQVAVVQLLGAVRNRLFVTLGGYPQGIRCYRAGTGNPVWTKPDEGDRATFGRGFLAGRWVFWPTRFGLKVLRQDDGEPEDSGSSAEPWGNLALGDGFLAVATPTELWGFVPERSRLGQRKSEVEEHPDDALAHYRLALSLADSGSTEVAIAEFRKAAQAPNADEFHQGKPLKDLARRRWHELLLTKAERMRILGEQGQAVAVLRQAAGEPFEPADRVRALVLLSGAGEKTKPDIEEKTDLRWLWVTRTDGIPVRANEFVDTLFATGSKPSDTLERARNLEKANEPWQAADGYRKALGEADFNRELRQAVAERRSAREGLIRLYEKAGFTDAARSLEWRFEQEYPIRDQRKRPPSPQPTTIPDLPEKLKLAWTVPLEPFLERPLRPFRHAATGEELPAMDEEGRAFFSHAREIACRSIRTGKTLWTAAIDHDADSVAFHAETAIVAGPFGISRFRRSDGTLLWKFLVADPRRMPTEMSGAPFRTLAFPLERSPFSAFRLAGSRLIFRSGTQRLFALDVETGRILWQFLPPGAPLLGPADGAAISKHFLANDEAVLVQTLAGKAIGIDAGNGKILFQIDAPAIWSTPPVQTAADTAVCSTDGEHLVALQLRTGVEIWNHTFDAWASLSGAAAQVRLDGANILVQIERNYGLEWERRDAKTGERNLPPMFLGRDANDLFSAGIAKSVYVSPSRDQLRAFSRENGERAWITFLPKSGPWRVHSTRSTLLLFPAEAIPEADIAQMTDLAAHEIGTIPTLGRIHTASAMLYHAWIRRTAPLLTYNAADGKILQIQSFPANGPNVSMLIGEREVAIAVEGRMQGLIEAKKD